MYVSLIAVSQVQIELSSSAKKPKLNFMLGSMHK